MITTINEFKNRTHSMSNMELYNKLKPYFNPEYNIERPSGHFLNNIEMRLNNNTKYSDIKNIIKDANWYLSKINNGQIRTLDFNDNEIKKLTIKPIYSDNIIKPIPNVLYHFSPSFNDESILKDGILCKTGGKKGILTPPRIYLSIDIKTIEMFVKELNYTYNTNKWTIWQIDTSEFFIDKLYIDDTVNQSINNPKACYIQYIDIPQNTLSIYKRITI